MTSQNDNPLSDIRIGQFSARWAKSHGIPVKFQTEMTSTNLIARDEAFSEDVEKQPLYLYLCDLQTQGKGRGSNKWATSVSGSQLFSTWSFALSETPLPILSPLMGLAVLRALFATWPFLEWSLKAPNDIYIDDKKIAGILLETISQGDQKRLLVGLGFNVLAAPKEIETATHLMDCLDIDTPLLAQDWVAFLERLVFELTLSLQEGYEPLSSTTQANLLWALNRNEWLEEKYQKIDESANLTTKSKKISWTSL